MCAKKEEKKILKSEEGLEKDFLEMAGEIISSDEFIKMKKYKQHIHGNTYDHSVRVAYLCYRHCIKHKSKVNVGELVRGALLHDYFLYDLHGEDSNVSGIVHGYTHPSRALENAIRAYPDLSPTERDAIRRHMFPLTPIPPRTRCGWLVCYYDKIAALEEYFGKNVGRVKKKNCY